MQVTGCTLVLLDSRMASRGPPTRPDTSPGHCRRSDFFSSRQRSLAFFLTAGRTLFVRMYMRRGVRLCPRLWTRTMMEVDAGPHNLRVLGFSQGDQLCLYPFPPRRGVPRFGSWARPPG